MGLCVMAYDNLDFDFKTKEPSDQNQGTFLSITTATFIPLTYGATLNDLRDSRPPTLPDQPYLFDRIQEQQDNVL